MAHETKTRWFAEFPRIGVTNKTWMEVFQAKLLSKFDKTIPQLQSVQLPRRSKHHSASKIRHGAAHAASAHATAHAAHATHAPHGAWAAHTWCSWNGSATPKWSHGGLIGKNGGHYEQSFLDIIWYHMISYDIMPNCFFFSMVCFHCFLRMFMIWLLCCHLQISWEWIHRNKGRTPLHQDSARRTMMNSGTTGVGKYPNWTSPKYWGYFISNKYLKGMFRIPKLGHLPSPEQVMCVICVQRRSTSSLYSTAFVWNPVGIPLSWRFRMKSPRESLDGPPELQAVAHHLMRGRATFGSETLGTSRKNPRLLTSFPITIKLKRLGFRHRFHPRPNIIH